MLWRFTTKGHHHGSLHTSHGSAQYTNSSIFPSLIYKPTFPINVYYFLIKLKFFLNFGLEKICSRVKYSKFEHCVELGLLFWGKWPIFWTKTNIGHAIGIVAYMSKKLELWPIDYAVFILFDDLELATTTLLSFLIDIKAMCMYDVLLFLQHKSCYEKKTEIFQDYFHQPLYYGYIIWWK